ncbi:MAG: PAS domain S-box protein, partial [Actinomycetota bacterium]
MTIGTSAGISTMDRLSRRFVARVGAGLLAVSAVFSVVDVTTARRISGNGHLAVIVVSVAAFLLAVPAWMLPWQRWPRRALLALLPVALVLLGVGNAVNPDRFAIGIYFVVAAMWIGLAQRPGTMVVLAPAFAIAYALPLHLAGFDDRTATRALPVVVVACILVGESLSYVSTRLRRAQRALDEGMQRRYGAMVRRSSDVTAVVSRKGLVEYVSLAARPTLGIDPDALVDTTVDQFVAAHVHPEDVGSLEAFSEIPLGNPGLSGTLEVRLVDDDGAVRYVEVTASNLLDDLDVHGIVLNLRDISDRKTLEAQLSHQAFHDPLCGLANRALFDDRLHQALAGADGQHRGPPVLRPRRLQDGER